MLPLPNLIKFRSPLPLGAVQFDIALIIFLRFTPTASAAAKTAIEFIAKWSPSASKLNVKSEPLALAFTKVLLFRSELEINL